MLDNNVMYRCGMKPSYFSSDSLLIFQKYIVIFKDFNLAFDSVN